LFPENLAILSEKWNTKTEYSYFFFLSLIFVKFSTKEKTLLQRTLRTTHTGVNVFLGFPIGISHLDIEVVVKQLPSMPQHWKPLMTQLQMDLIYAT
jgi:hypothetical protein